MVFLFVLEALSLSQDLSDIFGVNLSVVFLLFCAATVFSMIIYSEHRRTACLILCSEQTEYKSVNLGREKRKEEEEKNSKRYFLCVAMECAKMKSRITTV